ncbi:hypothetical protein BGZ97_004335, partial [Linnemannia gamsii]
RRKDTNSGFSIVFPDRKGSSQYDHERRSRSRSRGGHSSNNNTTVTRDERISVDSFPGHSFPGDQSSMHDDRDLEMALPLHNSTLPFPESPYSRPRQPPIIPVNPRSQPPTASTQSISIPMPETPDKQIVEDVESVKHSHIQIDMVGTDLASLMPIVVSNEIKPVVVQPSPQVAQEYKPDVLPACTQSASATETEDAPRESTDTIILPVPVPRRPKIATRISTDSVIQGGRARISIAYPPPPPPPTIPPPAIPSGGQEPGRVSAESSNRSSVYSVSNHPTGRRPTNTRTSTENSRIPCSRRSVSMDAASFTPDGRRLSRKLIILPPSMPPPVPLPPPPPVHLPTPSSPSSTPVPSTPSPSRRRHQRNPSQTLNTSLFDSSDRSAISPPLSPLTIQIPRPSSRSFQSLLTINTQLTVENVQQYLQQQQPQPLEICKPDSPTDSIFAVSPRTSSLHHTPRSRSKSATHLETQRIMIPPSPATPPAASSSFSPPVPPVPTMPSSLADHLPLSSPRSTSSQSYTSHKQPSLSHQQSSSSLDSARPNATTTTLVHGDQHHDYQHYERGAYSPESKKRHNQKQHRRRSMSAPTSPSSPTPSLSSSPPSSSRHQRESSTSPSGRRSKEEDSVRTASVSPSSMNMNKGSSAKDQELQAIIADAIAIAAAKTAAIETARQNNNSFHRQLQAKQQQHLHHQYLNQHHQYQQQQFQQFQNQRRVHPQMMDPWRSHTPSTAESSRPGSPL